MPLPSSPTTVIAPVISVTTGTNVAHELWGTAFLVGPHLFMSARHVFGVEVPEGQTLSVVLFSDEGLDPIPVPVTYVYTDPGYDIAIARVEYWPRDDSFSLAPDDRLTMNTNILTIEYSEPGRQVPLEDGGTAMGIGPNWHKGYMVREYIARFGHARPTGCLDLSFPALRGASGAPVVDEISGLVLGMIVGNVERHLMPSQIERTIRSDGTVDEIRYFAPYAQAIMARHLRHSLEEGRAVVEKVRRKPNHYERSFKLATVRDSCCWCRRHISWSYNHADLGD